MAWTFLRPGTFTSNAESWADTIRREGAVYMPVGDGTSPVIDPADVGEIAAKVLTTPGHEKRAYTLSGPARASTSMRTQTSARTRTTPGTTASVRDPLPSTCPKPE